ncbi:hypothetical protein D4764_20G0006650 [Takifugu flavidus]|uniref:Uncharacterized protein n=1 Tax=Takifugu flavidus TaxID=433684 RepID=A0A5C6NHF1_9TELE|nr:hypothetical protein D4764_20G0006650 [Takifugu flavidus]
MRPYKEAPPAEIIKNAEILKPLATFRKIPHGTSAARPEADVPHIAVTWRLQLQSGLRDAARFFAKTPIFAPWPILEFALQRSTVGFPPRSQVPVWLRSLFSQRRMQNCCRRGGLIGGGLGPGRGTAPNTVADLVQRHESAGTPTDGGRSQQKVSGWEKLQVGTISAAPGNGHNKSKSIWIRAGLRGMFTCETRKGCKHGSEDDMREVLGNV